MVNNENSLIGFRILNCWWMRYGLMALGFASTGLGVAGVFLPVMPSTIFFIIALWAFSKSSVRFHYWLYNHPRFGPSLQAWHQDRVISAPAKIAAVSMMSASLLFVTIFVAKSWVLPVSLFVILGLIATYIVTRPSRAASC